MLVAQSCLTLCDPMDCSLPGSSVHGILQARVLEWVAMPFSRGSSWPRDQTQVSCIAGRFSTIWTTREALYLRLLFFKCLRTTCANPSGGLFKMQIPSLQLISLESLRWGPEVFNLMKISSSSYASNTEEALQCRWSLAEGNGYPLQYSCLENSMDRGVWRVIVIPWSCKESNMTEQLIFTFEG